MVGGILELIPINHEYKKKGEISIVHFSRIGQLMLKREKVDKITYLIFDKEKDTEVIEHLKGTLQLLYKVETTEFYISLNYPEIIRNIKSLRQKLEENFKEWHIFLNVSPLKFHLHTILLRDGLNSEKYTLHPYEILNFDYESFSYVVIPNYTKLDLIDLEIMEKFIDQKNEPTNLKVFIRELEAPGWDKSISTYDQKMRNRLNELVDRGLLDYKAGPNGEKFYTLKYFHLERNLAEGI